MSKSEKVCFGGVNEKNTSKGEDQEHAVPFAPAKPGTVTKNWLSHSHSFFFFLVALIFFLFYKQVIDTVEMEAREELKRAYR